MDVEKCVVTGGAGFIGSHLVDKLLESGCEVTVVDNLFTGNLENIKHNLKNKRFKFERMSVLNDDLKKIFSDVDTIFHLAAIPRVQYSMHHPYLTEKINVGGTLNVLEAARKADAKRVIFSSSSSVYGNQTSLPLREDMFPNPMSHYAVHKLAGEHYMRLYYEVYGLPTVIIRYFNVYGPRDDPLISPHRLIPYSIYLLYQGKQPIIHGDGNQTRDFTYVADAINATLHAATIDDKRVYGSPVNIGTGINTAVKKAIGIIQSKLGKSDLSPLFKPKLKEPTHTQADIEKAKNILGWEPKVSLEEGIKSTINWFVSEYVNRR